MASRKKKRMTIHTWDNYKVMDLGHVEIWDGADLALLRETLSGLVDEDGEKLVGVNMQYVKYIPSGFFGMMYDCQDKGVRVRMYTPQPNVERMLWFRQFLQPLGDGCFQLHREPKEELVEETTTHWDDQWADETETVGSRT